MGLAGATLAGCATNKPNGTQSAAGGADSYHRVRILATSDTHGKFLPWNYPADEEDTTGSMAQLAAAVRHLRDDKDTILVDAGDTIQDNMAEVFVQQNPDDTHPMIMCLNAMHYDIGVTGNHEYNYGMDVLRKTIASFKGKTITGNVIDEHGEAIADGHTIIEKNGVKIGFIGMVTPNIVRWDAANLEGCKVTDPVEETRKIIDKIKGQVDALVAVVHMGVENEYGVEGSGARDLANACPELDVIIASHEHKLVEGEDINGVIVVENKYQGQTMQNIELQFVPDGDGWKVENVLAQTVNIEEFAADTAISELMKPYDEQAKKYAHEVIGKLEGGTLAPTDSWFGCPASLTRDTALIDLIQNTQLHYTKADVSATAIGNPMANMEPGDIKRCDLSTLYKYTNTLYTFKMTGAQLRKYMEWAVKAYRKWEPGDLTFAFDPEVPAYNVDFFDGVDYEVDVAADPGSRIKNLKHGGSEVKDGDELVLACNNYRATSHLMAPGEIFEEGDLPELLEADVRGDIGGVRELIADYIVNVKGGTIKPECNDNWKLVGYEWDEEKHKKAMDQLINGEIDIWRPEDNKHLIDVVVKESDLK